MEGSVDATQLIEKLQAFEDRYHVERLVPQLLDLADEVGTALADGRLSVGEAWRIAIKLVKIVAAARKAG